MKHSEEFLLAYMKEHFAYEQDGFFVLIKKQYVGSRVGEKVGWLQTNGYWRISIKGKSYQAHRLVWLWHHKKMPQYDIDHVNGIKSDNRIENLRDVLHRHNTQNCRQARRNNLSGYLGVSSSLRKNKFAALLWANNKTNVLGYYDTAEQAHEAYLNAKRVEHEGCVI